MSVSTPPLHLLDQLTTAVVVVDPHGMVRFLNQAAEALLEISDHRGAGEPLARIFATPGLTPDELDRALAEGLGFRHREALGRNAAGNDVMVDCTVTPVMDGGPPALVLELSPLDRLARINRDEHHASVQDSSRRLVRGLAHEIKNPLGGIRGAAQLLERELASAGLEEYTRIIIDETDRLRNLLDRMLGPNTVPSFGPVNVHEVIERMIRLTEAEDPERVLLTRDYDPSLPEVEADRGQLTQALLNIVRNAREALASTERPEIVFTTRVMRQFTIGRQRHRLVLALTVSDNGPGVPPELSERLYLPMISGRADGSGLGLSITQSIIAQHHGILDCDSIPGCTRFSIYLPLEQSHG